MRKQFVFLTLFFSLFSIFFTTSSFAKPMNILVHPFENTGNKEYSWISAGMTDTVIADLARIKNISVVSNTDRKKILEEMKFIFSGLAEEDKMIKLGKLTGANVIFSGSYLVSGNRVRVHARLVNVETGKIESTAKIDGTLSGIFELQDKVVFNLMGETEKIQIGDIKPVKLTAEDKKTIEEKPKPKSAAYEWYAKGLEIQDTNPKEALTNFKKAFAIDSNYTSALMGAGITAGKTLNLFDEALVYLEKAEKILKGRNETDTADYAGLMMNIGLVYNSKGRLDRALEYYQNSQSVWDRLGLKNTAYYAGLMMNIGTVYDSKGQLDRALEYYQNSRSIYDRLGLQNTVAYATLMMNIGTVYKSKGQPDRALEYFLNSQSIQDSLRLQNAAHYAGLMMNIGNVYYIKDQLDRALEYYLNTQSQWDRLGLKNTAAYAHLMMNIGVVYKSKGQLDRALEYYQNSQSIQDSLGLQNTDGYARLIFNIAWVYERQGKRDMAGRYYGMSYDTFVKAGFTGQRRDDARKNAERLGTSITVKSSAAGEKAGDGRFIAYYNGTVLDTQTGLMWAAKDNGSNIDWKNAKSYCENYRGGGYSDWRLPTQDELVGLYDRSRSKPRPAACDTSSDIHVATKLIDITCVAPWASETRGSEAACFHFLGKRFWSPQSEDSVYRALPVRSAK